jgi:hypothetical protein
MAKEMITLQVPVFKAIRWMVFDIVGPLRGFATQEEAKHFVGNDSGLTIVPIPKKFKTIEVEEALF